MNKYISFLVFLAVLLYQPVLKAQDRTLANEAAIVKSGVNTRFTVLTPQTVRMEWDSTGAFNNYASFVVINRNLPVPYFTKSVVDGWLVIKTQAIEIRYKENSGRFGPSNLSIKYLKEKQHEFTWLPGIVQKENLKGTTRTLDNMDGDSDVYGKKHLELENGLLAKDGWYFLDDSKSFLFDKSDWPWVKERPKTNNQDWYFMGYGHDYKSALYDFTLIAGKVPLPPRYAFGYWWSRYWKYSDNELRNLVGNFNRYNLPLDVLVIDMDWHKNLNKDGWTGWTFDDALFTDPGQFLKWTASEGLKVTMNLHPASGVDPAEPSYKTFATNMNFDTVGHKTIPYIGSDKKFMQNLFNVVLHPMEKQGVGFWWLDWQQWQNDKVITGLNNTWWINYMFFSDMERHSLDRPLLYHRWGGLGNHRYQTGFSGDTFITWKTLEYQPYFTNTASNVLYDYWSHDIGGHQVKHGESGLDPELYTRWVQYGALSPVFRTHSSKNPQLNKEPWNFKGDYFEALTNAIKLRYTLAPYIYTMARKTYDTGLALCRPLYDDYPESKEAYDFSREYQFGDNMLVAPIGAPMVNGSSTVKVWLPPGNEWYEWNTGTLLKGGQIASRQFSLLEYPIYIKSGSIIPMYINVKNLKQNPHQMIVGVFPGGNGSSAKIYEDAGDSKDYKQHYTFTEIRSTIKNRTSKVTILPRTGSYAGMAATKDYQVKLYGSEMPVSVLVNGNPIAYTTTPTAFNWGYDGSQLCVIINIPAVKCIARTDITVNYSKSDYVDVNDGLLEKMKNLSSATVGLKYRNVNLLIPTAIGSAEELNVALAYYPGKFYELIKEFHKNYDNIPLNVKKMNLTDSDEAWYLQALGFKEK
jgi:alpha-glucosidase (family GH31 glycosyl hydrolase)